MRFGEERAFVGERGNTCAFEVCGKLMSGRGLRERGIGGMMVIGIGGLVDIGTGIGIGTCPSVLDRLSGDVGRRGCGAAAAGDMLRRRGDGARS